MLVRNRIVELLRSILQSMTLFDAFGIDTTKERCRILVFFIGAHYVLSSFQSSFTDFVIPDFYSGNFSPSFKNVYGVTFKTLGRMSSNQHYWMDKRYPKLKGDVADAAIEGQSIRYPQVVRSATDPPVVGQRLGLISFMIPDAPMKDETNGHTIFSFVKLRGNYADVTQAEFESEKLITQVDSKFRIVTVPVGQWLPITDNPRFFEKMLEVKMGDQEVALKDRAAREKAEEEARIIRELKEAQERLRNGGDVYDDTSSLDYYTTKRCTFGRLAEERDILRQKLDDVAQKLERTTQELRELEERCPNHKDVWMAHYNAERAKSGIPPISPLHQYEKEYCLVMDLPLPIEASSQASTSQEATQEVSSSQEATQGVSTSEEVDG